MIITIAKSKILPLLQSCVDRDKPLLFVKDQGVYFMVGGETAADNIVQYLKGYDPNRNDDWYDNAGYKFGWDDFGHDLNFQEFFQKLIEVKDQWNTFRLHLNKNTIKATVN